MIKNILGKINQLSRRERLILAVTAAAISIFLLDRFVIERAFSYLREMDEKITLRKKEIRKNERLLTLRAGLESLYQGVVSGIRMTGTEDQNTAQVLREIEQVGTESEMAISNLKPRPSRTEDDFRIFAIDLEAEGRMEKLLTFLHKLQNAGRFFHVEGLKVRVHEKDPDLVRINMNLSKIALGKAAEPE